MSAGSGARIGWKAETVEDRSKCQHSHEQYRDVKVTELRRSGRVTVRMRDQAQRFAAGEAEPRFYSPR